MAANSQTRPVALVTGGAKRIGRAMCEDLAKHGFDVAVHYSLSEKEAEECVAALKRHGANACALQADLSQWDQTAGLVSAASAKLGPVQLLVNNASRFLPDALTRFDEATWDAHFNLHVKAPALLTQAFAAELPKDKEGLVVNIIDQRVWRETPLFFSYTLSKSALWTATRTMAQSLAPRIRVNAIGPGPTLQSDRQSDEDFRGQVAALPLQRSPTFAEFGATLRYLWESRSITGQMIALDGGAHLAWQTPHVAGVIE